jgi:hypothetical protein
VLVISKISVLLCVFSSEKRLNARDIHKEMFPVYGGKCLSRKAVHNWVEKRFTDEEIETEVRK